MFYLMYLSLAVSAFAVSEEDVIVARVLDALSEGLLETFQLLFERHELVEIEAG